MRMLISAGDMYAPPIRRSDGWRCLDNRLAAEWAAHGSPRQSRDHPLVDGLDRYQTKTLTCRLDQIARSCQRSPFPMAMCWFTLVMSHCMVPRQNAGCEDLLEIVEQIEPQAHIFGHIHEAAGVSHNAQTTFMNACICDLHYAPINSPIVFEYQG
jgi:hypothetical protein